MLAALDNVATLLDSGRNIPALKDVYVISDFQAAGWLPESTAKLVQMRSRLKDLSSKANLVLIDLGQSGGENAAITDFKTVDRFVTVGQTTGFEVTVQNFGRAPMTNRVLEFVVDGTRTRRTVDLAPGTSVTETFAHSFGAGGEHRLQAVLQGDALTVDDRRFLSVPVKEQVAVLCVNGKPSGEVMGNATAFLELSLQPSESSAGPPAGFQPFIVADGELIRHDQ